VPACPCASSVAHGVGQPASPPISASPLRFPPRLVCPPSIVFGVGHPANVAAPSKSIPPVCFAVLVVFGPPLGVFGVGHPHNSTVRRPLSVFPASL